MAIDTGVIVDADINASAAIALSKLASDPLARANHTGTQAGTTVDASTTSARGTIEIATTAEVLTGTATDLAVAPGSLGDLTKIARLTGNFNMTQSNTVLENITGLSFAIAENEVWEMYGVLQLQSPSTTSDFRVGWTGPVSLSTSLPAFLVPNTPGAANPRFELVSYGSYIQCGGVAATPIPVQVSGLLVNGATAGTVQLQIAQNTSTAELNQVLTGSYLRARRIA